MLMFTTVAAPDTKFHATYLVSTSSDADVPCRRKAVPEIQPMDEDEEDGGASPTADDWACDRTLQA